MKLRLTRRAHDDLVAILDFLAKDQENPNAARTVLERIERVFLHLKEMPGIGRAGLRLGTQEISIPHLPFTIVYRVSGDFVEILTIFHNSQDPKKKS